MSERLDVAHFYDHVIYLKNQWSVIIILLLTPLFVLGGFYLVEFFNPKEMAQVPWLVKFVLVGLIVLGDFVVFVFLMWWKRQLLVGVSRAGIYVHGSGMVSWAEIKSIKIIDCGGCKLDGTIKIKTLSSAEKGESSSRFQKIMQMVGLVFEQSQDKDSLYLYEGSVPQKELIKILKTYHEAYKKEGRVQEKMFERPAERIDTEVQEKERQEKKVWWIKVAVSCLIALGVFVFSLIAGKTYTDLLIGTAAGFFGVVLVLFWVPRLIVLFILSLLMVFGVPVFWVKQMISGNPVQWGFVGIPFFGILTFVIVLFDLSRRKKINIKNIRHLMGVSACLFVGGVFLTYIIDDGFGINALLFGVFFIFFAILVIKDIIKIRRKKE